jgi:hypothetical protein
MRHLTSSAILFAASLLFAFPAAAQTADYAATSIARASNLVPSCQSIDMLAEIPAAINISPDAQYKEEPATLPAVQFFPLEWSDCLLQCHSTPDLLLGLLGLGLLGVIGTVVAARGANSEKERP